METIIDIFGNRIQVTDRMKAVRQATFCTDSFYKMNSFHFENGRVVEDLHHEEITVGDYNKHLLIQLRNLKLNSNVE